jgi:hypothetical protein
MIHFKSGGNGIYGKSIYYKSTFFARLYLTTLMAGIMKKLSSIDQRIYYVETALDNDTEGSVIQFARDIKQKNVSLNQDGDISSIIRKASPYKDMVIPVVNGNKPVEFDVLQGMNADVDNDFLDKLKNSMIAGTGVPQAFLGQRTEMDFAKSISMMNGSFTKMILRFQNDFSKAYTKLLNTLCLLIYEENKIVTKCSFAPPASLNIDNTNSALSNASSIADTISNISVPLSIKDEEKDKYIAMLKYKYIKKNMPHLDWVEFEEIQKKTLIEILEFRLKNSTSSSSSSSNDTTSSDMGSDMSF